MSGFPNTIPYPLNLPLQPSAYTLEMISMSNTQSSPYNMRQTISFAPAAQMWALYLTFPPIVNPVLAASASTFLSGLRGRLGTFKFFLPNRDLSYTGTSTLLYKDILNDTRNNIEISNASSLNSGTYITIGTQLLKVLNVSGDNVNIFPSLRKDISVDTEVKYENNTVFGTFRQKNHSGLHTFNNNHVYTFDINAVEATNV